MKNVTVIKHPLVQHKLTLMRKKETSTAGFRRLLQEISMLLGYEVTRDMPLTYETIETPITTMDAPILDGKKVAVISIYTVHYPVSKRQERTDHDVYFNNYSLVYAEAPT